MTLRQNHVKYMVAAVLVLIANRTYAVNTWYWGEVTQVITLQSDGSFLVHVDNAALHQTCAYKRVNFMAADMGAERTRAALSMAMTALVSGRQYGVVVDLPPQGQTCYVAPSSSQGAGIR